MKKNRILIVILSLVAIFFCFMDISVLADENDARVMVSLGDSYSSGEGIPPFYGQKDNGRQRPVSEKVKSEDWLAHRSTNAWPSMLRLPGNKKKMAAYHYPEGQYWYFAASSGATTSNMKQETQCKKYNKEGCQGERFLEPQLTILDSVAGGKENIDYVTLTIGGNDAKFVEIIEKAALSHINFFEPYGLTDKIRGVWREWDRSIRNNLREVYRDVSHEAPNATIIVAGYPQLISNNGFSLISDYNSRYINKNVSIFNDKIEELVTECREKEGMRICFVPVEEVFRGHEAYTDFSYINRIDFFANSEDLDGAFISAYSIHPNIEGARAYAKTVQAVIDDLEKDAHSETDFETAYPDFSIIGAWKSVGEYGFGQAQPGSIVIFDEDTCNFYSPQDTYEFNLVNGHWVLKTRNVLWGDEITFDVEVIDENNILIVYNEDAITELTRLSDFTPESDGSEDEWSPDYDTDNEEYYDDDSESDEPDDNYDSDNNSDEMDSDSLNGTYVSYSYGIIKNTFTFYGDNQVSMRALGVTGDGTYEIVDDEMVITYNVSFSDKPYVWRVPFSRSGDSIYIAGEEFVKQY